MRTFQIIFSVVGAACSFFSFFFSLMTVHAALTSSYTLQVIGGALFSLSFVLAGVIFVISIFKPKILMSLFAVPVIMLLGSYLDSLTYNIPHKITEVPRHELIGTEFTANKKSVLISNLPKRRMRNYFSQCLHDYQLETGEFRPTSPPPEFWKDELGLEYQEVKIEDVPAQQKFKIIGAFYCGDDLNFTLTDSQNREIEADWLTIDLLKQN